MSIFYPHTRYLVLKCSCHIQYQVPICSCYINTLYQVPICPFMSTQYQVKICPLTSNQYQVPICPFVSTQYQVQICPLTSNQYQVPICPSLIQLVSGANMSCHIYLVSGAEILKQNADAEETRGAMFCQIPNTYSLIVITKLKISQITVNQLRVSLKRLHSSFFVIYQTIRTQSHFILYKVDQN